MSAIQIAGFPHVANSTFTGRIYGKIVVEQVLRAGRGAGSSDYAVVLHDRFNPSHRAVVSYTRFLTAIRSPDPVAPLLALYSEARNSGLLVAARTSPTPTQNTPLVSASTKLLHAGRELTTEAGEVSATKSAQPIVGDACCETPVKKDKDWAFDRMTELLKVALYDKEVADVIKRLTHVL